MKEDTVSSPCMEPLLFSVDPTMSLLLSQNPDNNNGAFERGPRYREYATLRESKLRLKREYEKILKEEEDRFFGGEEKKKQTRFGFTSQDEIKPSPNLRRLSSSSSLAQSVPDFSAVIRKENRRPTNSNTLPRRTDRTPPQSKSRTASVFSGSVSCVRGSVSASGGEKRSKGMMNARKSYATVEDLKKISTAAASAINGGGRKSIGGGGGGRRISLGGGTILGYRQT